MTRLARRRPANRARGSVTAEIALIAPLVLLVALLLAAGWRVANTRLIVEGAARDAARAASLSRAPTRATHAAQTAATATLAQQHPTCHTPQVTTDTSRFTPGGWVAVRVTCRLPLADLALLPVPGTITTEASFVHPVDLYRATLR